MFHEEGFAVCVEAHTAIFFDKMGVGVREREIATAAPRNDKGDCHGCASQ